MVRAWHGLGMASVNQTRPHCVNQMGKTHSKPLAARHGRGTAWARHAMCESAFTVLVKRRGCCWGDGRGQKIGFTFTGLRYVTPYSLVDMY